MNHPRGTIKVTFEDGHSYFCLPDHPRYSERLFCASHWWSVKYEEWISMEAFGGDFPTFLSLGSFAHLNSNCSPLLFGVMLDGEPVEKWETADSVRGYVDVWARQENVRVRHRLFGNVEFVQL